MNLSNKIVAAAIAAVGVTAIVSILVQKRSLEQVGVEMVHSNMRASVIEAERVRDFISSLNKAKAFDVNALLVESKKGGDLRTTALYQTIPVVSAWKAIEEVAKKQNYQFRIPKHNARNPVNLPTPDEEVILKALGKGDVGEYFNVDWKKKEIVYARPIMLTADCMACHGDPATSPTKDGKDMLGFTMEGWKVGEVHGAFVLKSSTEPVNRTVTASMLNLLCWVAPLSALAAACFWYIARKLVVRPLAKAIHEIREAADQTSSAAAQISVASQHLADGASSEAASLEESSASLEEMSSMTSRNAESAVQARRLSSETTSAAESGKADIEAMRSSMAEIKSASDNISSILRTIDEIAFQTNILALNAAVEAARAGEAGAGFAVVADEVRNLAQRSAFAAKETGERIEDSIRKSERGVQMSEKVVSHFAAILDKARKVDRIISEIATASEEQRQGIGQINTAISAVDKITQSTAAAAEESASASEELRSQADSLKDAIFGLESLVGSDAARSTVPGSASVTAPTASSHRSMNGFRGPVMTPKNVPNYDELPMDLDGAIGRPSTSSGREVTKTSTNGHFKDF